MKLFSIKWAFLIFLSTFLLMTVIKHQIQEIDRKILEIKIKSQKNKEEIKILEAELALLSSPKRIEKLSKELLNLNSKPLIVSQEISYLNQLLSKGTLNDEK